MAEAHQERFGLVRSICARGGERVASFVVFACLTPFLLHQLGSGKYGLFVLGKVLGQFLLFFDREFSPVGLGLPQPSKLKHFIGRLVC